MSKHIERFLTPDEVRALQEPAVQAEIRRINATLLQGIRHYWVPTPLFADIAHLLQASGWVPTNVQPLTYLGSTAFDLVAPQTGDNELVEQGARLMQGVARP